MKLQGNLGLIGFAAVFALSFSGQSLAEGNRYELPRDYDSEISSAKAYLEMDAGESVLIDVRRLREYRAGHPYAENGLVQKHAYHVPFPHKVDSNDQAPEDLYWGVRNVIDTYYGGDTSTPITTLCRTGFRSVLAGNILANPAAYGIAGPAFTNVRNIWEGFVGRYKEANVDPLGVDSLHAVGQTSLVGMGMKGVVNSLFVHEALHHQYLDLNNNDALDTDVDDVCDDTKDMNPDKDGWRNYQELPWSNELVAQYAYQGDTSQYPICDSP
jgi:rhodanese-related sulfurtransferase